MFCLGLRTPARYARPPLQVFATLRMGVSPAVSGRSDVFANVCNFPQMRHSRLAVDQTLSPQISEGFVHGTLTQSVIADAVANLSQQCFPMEPSVTFTP
jgi:hypothetical protein